MSFEKKCGVFHFYLTVIELRLKYHRSLIMSTDHHGVDNLMVENDGKYDSFLFSSVHSVNVALVEILDNFSFQLKSCCDDS